MQFEVPEDYSLLFTFLEHNSVYLISTGSMEGQSMIIQLLIYVYNNAALHLC